MTARDPSPVTSPAVREAQARQRAASSNRPPLQPLSLWKIPSQPHGPPPQIRKPCNGCCCGQANYQKFGLVETLPHAVPFFPQKVTQRDEDRSPTKRPGVGKQRKARKAQLRYAGDVSGQLSYTRDEATH